MKKLVESIRGLTLRVREDYILVFNYDPPFRVLLCILIGFLSEALRETIGP